MKKFAFISRHEISDEQISLANAKEISLTHVGDFDAFSVSPSDIKKLGEFDGVVVVHPAAAMRLALNYTVGVFKNSVRPQIGERPKFYASELELWDYKIESK